MTLQSQILSGVKWTAAARFGAQFITWGITLVVMRLLAPSDYGLLAMAMVWVSFFIMMAEAGLWPALVQKQELTTSEIEQAYGIAIIINVSLLIVLNLLAPAISTFFRDDRLIDLLRVLSLQFILTAMTVTAGAQLNRALRFKALSILNLIASIASSLLTLALAYFDFGVWALVVGTLFSGLVKAVTLNVLIPTRITPRFSLTGMRRLLGFGGVVTGSRLLWFVFTQADVLIVGRLLGKELLGLYSVAMHLASLPVQRVSSILNQVTFPVIARFQHDREGIINFVLTATRTLSLVAFPVLWGISSVASELVDVALGPRWHDAAIPLRLLGLMMPLRLLVNFLPSATDALGHPKLGFQNALLAAILMPAAFLIGTMWGIVGVAVAWVTVYPMVLVFNMRRMLRVMGLHLRDIGLAVAPSAGAAAVMYVSVWLVGLVIGGSQVAKLVGMMTIGALVYGLLTIAFNRQGYRDVLKLLRAG
jgi:O-antigen/teichoic acid export membrane protein